MPELEDRTRPYTFREEPTQPDPVTLEVVDEHRSWWSRWTWFDTVGWIALAAVGGYAVGRGWIP